MRFVIGLVICAFLLSGCGAIMHGRSQEITINSSPTESMARISGEERKTPAVFTLKRKNSYMVKISKEGYETAEVMINRKLDWTAWADLFLWGVIPIFYDLASGAAFKLTPEEINMTLQRSQGYLEGPEELEVTLKMKGDTLSVNQEGVDVAIVQMP